MQEKLIYDNILDIALNNAVSHFYQNTDAAHTLLHITEVKERALDMANWHRDKYNESIDMNAVLVAATIHDIGGVIDRDNHPAESIKLLLTDIGFKNLGLTKESTNIACDCIAQHSSHVTEPYKHLECEIVASADRDEPDVYAILRRSMKYAIAHYKNEEEAINSCVDYNCKRYGTVPSTDYRVPEWHFDYWEDKKPGAMKIVHNTFKDKELVLLLTNMIYTSLENGTDINFLEFDNIINNGCDDITKLEHMRATKVFSESHLPDSISSKKYAELMRKSKVCGG